MGVMGADMMTDTLPLPCTIKNQYVTFDSPKTQSSLGIHMGLVLGPLSHTKIQRHSNSLYKME